MILKIVGTLIKLVQFGMVGQIQNVIKIISLQNVEEFLMPRLLNGFVINGHVLIALLKLLVVQLI
jgi:hypothetical protein